MNRRFALSFVVLVLSLLTIETYAQDVPQGVRIDSMSSKGPGCPAGSVQWTLAPNASAVSILFDRYTVQGASPLLNTNCQVRFMLWYPKNYRLRVVGIDYRGGASLPQGAVATVSTKITQQISKIVRVIDEGRDQVRGPLEDNLLISRATTKGDWVSCGGVAALNYIFDSSVQVQNPTGQEAYLQIDSADVDLYGGFSFRLAWERCK